ncbi:MAG: 4-hydroxy-tetrahydrodipicolinate reductase [Deltaproteobacteria bacterium]|nr:4-hydroxy-tetrahydrodipicolinate reductase [Deltaproteobacteria bacterium]MCL5276376.1 4-hydroxy-tetrahydrodipicolinate reductase [Deltaproteobacteria bacterium]
MTEPIAVAVNGAMGRMGMQISKLLLEDPSCSIVAVVEKKGHPSVGVDIGTVVSSRKSGVLVSDDFNDIKGRVDCIIDFSAPASTLSVLRYAQDRHISMVIGTTGFSAKTEMEAIHRAGSETAIVMAPNMSVLMNVVFKLVELSARALGGSYDAEIVEAHHRNKVDAPSGTALKLADIIAHAYGRPLEEIARYERHGAVGARRSGEIGIQSLRGGDVVGEHTVMFIGAGERLEITHRATSRENFAQGAVLAAKWAAGKQPGLYSMAEVLGLT